MISDICFFNDTATTEIYTPLYTLSLHDALPIYFIVILRVLSSPRAIIDSKQFKNPPSEVPFNAPSSELIQAIDY